MVEGIDPNRMCRLLMSKMAECDENRLRILVSLSRGKKTASEIEKEVKISRSLVSRHLKALRSSLLIRIERKGPLVYYEITDERVMEVIEIMADPAK